MKPTPLRWLIKNVGTLLLAFILAVIVWISAVVAADPNEEHILARGVTIEFVGQSAGLQLMGSPQNKVSLTLKAPASVWTQINSDPQTIRAWVDLSELGAGQHTIPVQVQINLRLVRLVSQDPEELTITLEPLVSQVFPISLVVTGNPPTGYQADPPTLDPAEVTISGPESLVSKVKEVRLALDITGANKTITKTVSPTVLDADGKVVGGITVVPDKASITQPINLLGGFRYVIVRPTTIGQVANGYKLTNIFVSPSGLVVFSSDPQLVNDLPGYVETKPLDLTGAEDDFETLIDLNLPQGVSAVGDPKVLVQVSIAAIESSLAVSLPVEVVGLSPGLEVAIAPATVDVILSGPVPVLNVLEPSDIRVKVDLTDFTPGIYQITPIVDFLPEGVQTISIIPDTVEVTITYAPTPTPTPTIPVTETPTLTPTPASTPTP
jgi:YbbR domain-containing protein